MVILCLGFHFLLYMSVDKLHVHVQYMYICRVWIQTLFSLQMGLYKCMSCAFCESMCMSMRGHCSMHQPMYTWKFTFFVFSWHGYSVTRKITWLDDLVLLMSGQDISCGQKDAFPSWGDVTIRSEQQCWTYGSTQVSDSL